MACDVARADWMSVLHYHDRLHRLAPFSVGDAYDCHVLDPSHAKDYTLDLARRHIDASSFDKVLDASNDIQISAIVETTNIAGVEPAIAKGLGLLFGIFVMAHTNVRTSNPNFSFASGGHRIAFLIDDVSLDAPN